MVDTNVPLGTRTQLELLEGELVQWFQLSAVLMFSAMSAIPAFREFRVPYRHAAVVSLVIVGLAVSLGVMGVSEFLTRFEDTAWDLDSVDYMWVIIECVVGSIWVLILLIIMYLLVMHATVRKRDWGRHFSNFHQAL